METAAATLTKIMFEHEPSLQASLRAAGKENAFEGVILPVYRKILEQLHNEPQSRPASRGR